MFPLSTLPKINQRCSQYHRTVTGDDPNVSVAPFDEIEWQKRRIADSYHRGSSIPYVNPDETSYTEFFNEYLLKNLPCMVSPSLTKSWRSRKFWRCRPPTGNSGETELNYDYLLDVYGEALVSAVNCNDSEYKKGYGSRDCRDMVFRDYIEYLRKYETILPEEDTKDSCNESKEQPCLTDSCWYLKDWHIVRFHQTNPKSVTEQQENIFPYECPIYFQSDWLNEFCEDTSSDDYKFCYVGPRGSFTSFHADVYGSYSWSANIVGVKKWYLYPPGKERKFYDSKLKQLKFSWNDPGVCGEDYIEVIQNEGECIFVPSGWHHVVWNLTAAVSINHNWFNGSNLCYIWTVLHNALLEVEKELDDLRDISDFNEQCQLVLKANHGMDYKGFFEILTHVKRKRLIALMGDRVASGDDKNFEKMAWHANFDINAILHVVQEHCLHDPLVKEHFASTLDHLISVDGSG